MEYSVPMVLEHLSMDVKAGITKFGNFLGQQFHSIHRVAKNYGLVNLKLESQHINKVTDSFRSNIKTAVAI